MPWISKEIVNNFVNYIINGNINGEYYNLVKYEPVTGAWHIDNKNHFRNSNVDTKYGTNCRNALYIIESILNLREIKLYNNNGTLNEIENVCTRIKAERSLDILVVDYLQLIELKNVGISAKDLFSIVLDRLLKLSKELNITILTISQLCRDVDIRNDHKPELEDIKKFGLLDEKSDMVVFSYPDRDDKLIINPAKQKLS